MEALSGPGVNDQVYRDNTRIERVPGAILAPVCGWRPRAFFAAEPGDLVRPDVGLPAR